MAWEDLLGALVGFAGREVQVQVWNTAEPEAEAASVISTTFGTLAGVDRHFENAMPNETLLLSLRGAKRRDQRRDLDTPAAFVSAERLDAERIEITLLGTLLGIYAT